MPITMPVSKADLLGEVGCVALLVLSPNSGFDKLPGKAGIVSCPEDGA